ncbi:MAG TPA: SDR family NAD(P)-dependent oxidoreductase [Acidimicrobiales bacterium]|nr:SDR family NAD(P)-dependent oxidoreductase [Acidimicrobiales bacterium]
MAGVVLITGASAGIGQACAQRLDRNGWTVVGASRRGTTSAGSPMVMDVDDDDSVRTGVARVVEEHKGLDAVVAGAGWGLAGAVELTPVAEAKDQFETNFWGAVRVVAEALPVMRRQGRGRVVLISSIGGVVGLPFQAFYSASKFAMEGYGEALAYEVAPFGIQVTLVQPGNVRTNFTAARRDVGTPDPEGTYRAALAKAVGLMEKDEANGVDPDRVAAAVERVLTASRPRRRVSVGKMDERVGILAKRLLPFRIFETGAKGSLGCEGGPQS